MSRKELIQYFATTDLLKAFHPDNPREHRREEIERRSLNLLWYGWLEIGIALNDLNQKLISGHGTVLSANWLLSQSSLWFDNQLDAWQKRNKVWKLTQKANLEWLEKARERFSPEYWQTCPVRTIELTDPLHEAMMASLNLSKKQSPDDPKRLAALLSTMGFDDVKDSGISSDRQADLLQKYKLTVADKAEEIAKNTDLRAFGFDDQADDDEGEYDEGEYESDNETESSNYDPEPSPVIERVALAITLPWLLRKRWSSYKLEHGIIKDTDAFLKLHEAFQ